MSELFTKILSHLNSPDYQPVKPRGVAHQLDLAEGDDYHAFRTALRDLMHAGRVVVAKGGNLMIPTQQTASSEFVGSYRHNRRGFGFVVPTDPAAKEDLFIPEGNNAGAITGDIVAAKIVDQSQRDGRTIYAGRILRIIERTHRQFAGTLVREGAEWLVFPDGNVLTEAISVPDAASRHVKPGTKVIVDIIRFATPAGPTERGRAVVRSQGVITEILGRPGEKDVDLKSVIVQFNLPGPFADDVLEEARSAVDDFAPDEQAPHRYDLSEEVVCTIDPDDAKDYDDAISLKQLETGDWELGVHIADVAHFVTPGSALDEEAKARGNSCYFPGHVIPMLPEILSNGVCSLQEGVPRLCKSAFIVFDADSNPTRTRFANTIIKSQRRLRYTEAQALIDHAQEIPHPQGKRRMADYEPEVLELLDNMNVLAKRLQARRHAQGQLVLDLPEVELVLDEEGRVVDAVPEDTSFTHTIIEMFMVEANEAAARLLDSLDVPFLRRVHPEPEVRDSERLRHFAQVSGQRVEKDLNRRALQKLLASVKGKPEAFAINLAVLKSLTRAEYSPEVVGHYALASEHYCHFTSPIRRYADLTIHRLLDAYIKARDVSMKKSKGGAAVRHRQRVQLDDDAVLSHDQLVEMGRHISYTERRAEDAERELRQVKVLQLLEKHIGDIFDGVVTGITKFGIFIQLGAWLIDGLIRYEDLMNDWWDVDERGGFVRGERTGKRIAIGDRVKAIIVKVDLARRELNVAIKEHFPRVLHPGLPGMGKPPKSSKSKPRGGKANARGSKPDVRGTKPQKSPPRGGQSRTARPSRKRR